MRHLILDLETLSIPDADVYLEPVEAPANYKDPFKIDAYKAERRAKLLERCALDPDLCRVVCAGLRFDDGADSSVAVAITPDDEAPLLRSIWDAIRHADVIVGFNTLSFDLPVLIRRSQYLGIPLVPLSLDKYRTPHVDLYQRLSFNGTIDGHSLDFYCRRFGIVVPDLHDGSGIAGLAAAEDWAAIQDHCRADVERTYQLAVRLGVLSQQTADVL